MEVKLCWSSGRSVTAFGSSRQLELAVLLAVVFLSIEVVFNFFAFGSKQEKKMRMSGMLGNRTQRLEHFALMFTECFLSHDRLLWYDSSPKT